MLGFDLRPGHILQVADADSLLAGQALRIPAVAMLRANDARNVVVSLIHRATGHIWERVPIALPPEPDERSCRPLIDV